MKILFLVRHYGYLRNFESVIQLLSERGHEIHLAADREDVLGGKDLVERLSSNLPTVTHGWTPDREGDDWLWLATKLRLAQDYLRYLDPRYDQALQLRLRAEERTPLIVLGLIKLFGIHTGPGRAIFRALLNLLEQSIPRDPALDQFIHDQEPDLVLLTPLVDLGSPQLDHLKSARSLGIRTALCVNSWDHLSSKSLIRIVPDRIFVWNEVQKQEAIELHGVPSDCIVVTGAQCFDQWFERSPSCSRKEFCQSAGLPLDRPYILWVCSSLFRGSQPETDLIEEWIQKLRASSEPVIRDAAVLVRPHPSRLDEWRRIDLSDYGHVTFRGSNPIDERSKSNYFDALYYSDAVVGLNTSAMLEAGIIGRPVLSLVRPNYVKNQEGTLHWNYLLKVGGGLLKVSRGFDEHFQQLKSALSNQDTTQQNTSFTSLFIRPNGIKEAATPIFVEELEKLETEPIVTAVGAPLIMYCVYPLLYPLILFRKARARYRQIRKNIRKSLKRTFQNIKRSIRQAVKKLILKRVRTEQQTAIIPKSIRARTRAQNLFDTVDEVVETKEAIDRIARSRRTVIVGPWVSETGFELLYWIPFLNWAKAQFNLRDDRLLVVSRGGVSTWYHHLASNYKDVFDFYTPDEFRSRNEERERDQGGKQKHVISSDFDKEIIDRVKFSANLKEVDVLHPSLMYNLFRMFWRLHASIGLVQGYTRHRRFKPPPLGEMSKHLPEDYIAVKFYANQGLPETKENKQFISEYLNQLTQTHDVVLLSTGIRFDDHDDFSLSARKRIHTVDRLITPSENLDLQTRIIANARAFVGTYGGFSYLAPLCGVDTLAFFSDALGFRMDHLEIAKRVFAELQAGSFVPLDVRDLGVLRIGLGVGGISPNPVIKTDV